MTVLDRLVSEREVGGLPLSIATSLACEAALGIHPEIKVDSPPILKYRMLMVNVRTLIRNILGALTTDGKKAVTAGNILPALVEEMQIIESSISKATNGKVLVTYYISSYQKLKQLFPHAFLRTANTEIQKHQQAIENAILKGLRDIGLANDVRYYDVYIEGKFQDTMLLTHIPVDLLSADRFSKLVLLESHTGAIKPHLSWYTKLTNGKELFRMPFNRFTLQVFGDNGVHFAPMSMKMKQAVKDISEKYKWSSITTHDKMVYGIGKIEDKSLRASLQSLL